MNYTGFLVVQYVDENPNSPTYGETWTERVLDTNTCPSGSGGEWSLIASECEMTTSGFTGKRINTYYNDVTGEYSSTTVSDANCALSAQTYDDEEHWINSGDPYCEIAEDGTYTGWGIQVQYQVNQNFLSYASTRNVRVAMAECSGYTQPQWEEISHQCHVVTDELTCYLTFDGTADILQIDVNPSSPSFNQTRTISGESEECICEACDRIEEEWRFVDDICGIQMPSRYGLTGLTNDTVYHVYRKYGTCIIGGESGRTKPMNEYSAVTYQTGVEDCVYRWVDTEEVVCTNAEYRWIEIGIDSGQTCSSSTTDKFTAIYASDNYHHNQGVYQVSCNGDWNITNNEIDYYNWSVYLNQKIAFGCITGISDSIYNLDVDLIYESRRVQVFIPNNVTTIGNNVFWVYCSKAGTFEKSSFDLVAYIPETVTSIGNNSFRIGGSNGVYEYAYLNVYCPSVTPPTIGTNALTATANSAVIRIYVPLEAVTAYQTAWPNHASYIRGMSGLTSQFSYIYGKEKQQVSTDGGSTWTDTGVLRDGSLYDISINGCNS